MDSTAAPREDTSRLVRTPLQGSTAKQEHTSSKVVRLSGKRCDLLDVMRASTTGTGPLFTVRMPPPGLGAFDIDIVFVKARHTTAFAAKYPSSRANIGGVELQVVTGDASGVTNIEETNSYGMSRTFDVLRVPNANGNVFETPWPIPKGQSKQRATLTSSSSGAMDSH
ncbi:hypothetical protein BDV96DRAFT_689616 [Lophiotrema nucula]|uniref:Uncharacterized protein n=1 Tax=Lophiotrema nucula TaxID=690887 RepID=A0A6A5YYV2_9PLEO|nr:hypothetical protein BDV96DRAFT_689616 [Lophiotrema nucula]